MAITGDYATSEFIGHGSTSSLGFIWNERCTLHTRASEESKTITWKFRWPFHCWVNNHLRMCRDQNAPERNANKWCWLKRGKEEQIKGNEGRYIMRYLVDQLSIDDYSHISCIRMTRRSIAIVLMRSWNSRLIQFWLFSFFFSKDERLFLTLIRRHIPNWNFDYLLRLTTSSLLSTSFPVHCSRRDDNVKLVDNFFPLYN